MSQEELSNFIFAAEHSHSLRVELKSSTSNEKVIKIARKYGFRVNSEDLLEDVKRNKATKWFLNSKINPIKNHSY